MFSMVIAPMIMFACAYYPGSALSSFPILQYAVPIKLLVYASQGLRVSPAPQFPHVDTLVVIGALVVIDAGLLDLGLKKFHRKAVS